MAGRLTYAQLEGLWIAEGGPRNQAPTAAAIALAESGGDPNATNPNDNGGRQTSWGLWQISNGTHAAPAPGWAKPTTNARLAVGKYKAAGNSFSPWGTFTSGAYRKYMNNGTSPDFTGTGVASAPINSSSGSGTDPGCLIPFTVPGVSLPLVGNVAGGSTVCLARKSQARAVLGGLLIGAGALAMFGGVAILVGRGLERSQAGQIALGVAGVYTRPARAVRGAAANRRRSRAERSSSTDNSQASEGAETEAPAAAEA